jgi:hypothetical protein
MKHYMMVLKVKGGDEGYYPVFTYVSVDDIIEVEDSDEVNSEMDATKHADTCNITYNNGLTRWVFGCASDIIDGIEKATRNSGGGYIRCYPSHVYEEW